MTSRTALPEYTDDKRLAVYKMLTSACTHLFSKNKLVPEKFTAAAAIFADLAKNDPLFMAHLTAWAMKGDSKDLKVLCVFFNSLNDADGTPFFKGSSKNKPNLRQVSYACLQKLDPHLAERVLLFCNNKFGVKDLLNEARHFGSGFKKAFAKYLRYREQNIEMLRGARNKGMTSTLRDLYRFSHTRPSDEAVALLNWKQKEPRETVIEMEKLPKFDGMTAKEIAAKIDELKLSPMVALSVIPQDKMTSAVATALLRNCTGNQTIILYNWFNRNGFFDVKAIKDLFKDKVQESTTAIDRIDTLTKDADASDKKEIAAVRSQKRKALARTGDIGKIFLHIDKSSSMAGAIEFAKEKASIIAECLENPKTQFAWGLFGQSGKRLSIPDSFTKEDFHQLLYGVRANEGATDCIALYADSREFGADIDIYVTDQQHNVGVISQRLRKMHNDHPEWKKPRASLIVTFSPSNGLEMALKEEGIPVSVIQPESLTESALVAQSVRHAMVGELAIIDAIMETSLPDLPKWYYEITGDESCKTPVEA